MDFQSWLTNIQSGTVTSVSSDCSTSGSTSYTVNYTIPSVTYDNNLTTTGTTICSINNCDEKLDKLLKSGKVVLSDKYKKELEVQEKKKQAEEDIKRFNSMFKNARVIVNDPAVILLINGEKFVSKSSGEDFDAEKGLMMCLLKWKGLKNIDIQKLLKRNTFDVNASKSSVVTDEKTLLETYETKLKSLNEEVTKVKKLIKDLKK